MMMITMVTDSDDNDNEADDDDDGEQGGEEEGTYLIMWECSTDECLLPWMNNNTRRRMRPAE